MKKITAYSLISLLFLSCSFAPNTQNQELFSNSRLTAHGSLVHDTSSPSLVTRHSSPVKKETSSPSPQTPLLGGAGVGSRHPSLNFTALEKEFKSFSTKALSDAYVKRMFAKYLGGTVNSVQLTRQLEFSRYLKNNGDSSYETSLKSMFISTPSLYNTLTGISAVSAKMTTEPATFGSFVQGLSPYLQTSCKTLKNGGFNTNGVYQIDQDNNFSTPKINVYCNMTTDGGGWTLVSAQYENDTASWNEGIQADYDPTLVTNKGFALNSSQLPADRTQTCFGKDLIACEIDYTDFVYTTGDIAITFVSGKKTANTYHIYRNSGGFYGSHDPESTVGSTSFPQWFNTLTFDKTGGTFYTWAFATQHGTVMSRGYSYNGTYMEYLSQSFAWTVWVR